MSNKEAKVEAKDVPYNEFGWREVDGNTWYPHWSIVYYRDPNNLFTEVEISQGAYQPIDLKERLLEVSREHPEQDIRLRGDAVTRMVARNGKIVKERKFNSFFYTSSDYEKACEDVFDNLKCCDHDGMGGFLFP